MSDKPTTKVSSSRVLQWPQALLRVGIARADVTPPVGIYHRAWGAAAHDRAEGVHRPLTATALYCAPCDVDTADGVCFVALDHCLFWTAEMRQLLVTAAETAGVDSDRIFVCFSHTHAAGLLGWERQHEPGGELIPGYLQQLAQTIGQLIRQAWQSAQSVWVVFGEGRSTLAGHRDYFDDESGQYVCGFNPDGLADDRVLVGRISDGQGNPVAVLVNYACHPTTLAWQNRLISPDFVGALRETVERETAVPCLFFQGASGDIGPREGFVSDPHIADRNGRQLGYAVLEALCDLPPPGKRFVYTGPVVSGATIGTWGYAPIADEQVRRAGVWYHRNVPIRLPIRSDLPDRRTVADQLSHWQQREQELRRSGDTVGAAEARAQAERARRMLTRLENLGDGSTFQLNAHIWRLGEAVWVALNGEYYNVLQRRLRAAFSASPIWVLTLVNGSDIWYVPDANSYGKGIYQERTSIVEKGSLEKIIEELEKNISELLNTEPKQ